MTNAPNLDPKATPGSNGLRDFLGISAALVALRLLIGSVAFPTGSLLGLSLLVSVLFVAAPIFALFRGASIGWTWGKSLGFLVVGLLLWKGAGMLVPHFPHTPLLQGLCLAVSQQSLVVWCLGLGATIALIVKDKNLLLPIAIFLALFDMWLVFSPMGVVNREVIQGTGKALANVAYQVPKPEARSAGGYAAPLAYVGPADYLFLAMFFVALFRFRMRISETFRASVPTLALYLLIVLCFGAVRLGPITLGALPALLPIGLVVLIVNRKEFQLARDEKIATALLAVGGIAFVTWSIVGYQPPKERVELSTPDDGPVPPGSLPTPAPVDPGPHPSRNPRVPTDRPNLR